MKQRAVKPNPQAKSIFLDRMHILRNTINYFLKQSVRMMDFSKFSLLWRLICSKAAS